jgi:hypothetical protein
MKVITTEQMEQLKNQLPTMQLNEIGQTIRQNWPKVYFGAVPYLDAICFLSSIDQNYMADSGKSIVIYFLSNATTWRGEVARLVKAELKKRAGIK